MKTIIILAAIVLTSTNAMAISAYNSQSLTCATVHEKMAQEGSIVLRYPSHSGNVTLFNRTVSNSMSCLGQGTMTSATVPTSDDPKCKIKTCSFGTGKGPNKNH
ncbi:MULTISPECIES: hypothetical protein [unclassified Rhizobium]|jgi:hypothetical protein|uniref:hypothetical protein n=1 Tax=unclassified Rhizobium TaxID=2613769 RepID=UPI00064646F8|nr:MULTISPECIES: hypothetical protein [unclassified Rhizobium]MBN8949190.1 hypothetical protein [Rhizobium tropici]OJY75005.1 MAG: hypothetical protein BGP09_34925 [Rhizobium sp. 60-20]RKD71023.1 hypothetical protein BJ928_103547 [Rhizobium sp. WW_1]